MITYICLILEILFIDKFLETGKRRYTVWLVLLSILLANTHAALYPMYLIVFLPYIAEYLIALVLKKKERKEDSKISIEYNKFAKWIVLIFVLCIFAGLLTPIKDIPYTYIVKSIQGNTMGFIAEHQPVVLIHDLKLLVLLILILGLLIFDKTKVKLRDMFMLIGMGILSIISYKQFPIFLICTMCIINKMIFLIINNKKVDENKEEIKLKKSKKFFNKIKQMFPKLLGIKGIIFIILIIVIVFLLGYRDIVEQDYVDKQEYPVEAVKWIKNNIDIKDMRLFNDFNYGSYLLFEDIPVFIDGRADVYDLKFNGNENDTFLDYMLATSLRIWYEDIINNYSITHIITKSDSTLNMLLEKNEENYKILYRDMSFVIYKVEQTRLSLT